VNRKDFLEIFLEQDRDFTVDELRKHIAEHLQEPEFSSSLDGHLYTWLRNGVIGKKKLSEADTRRRCNPKFTGHRGNVYFLTDRKKALHAIWTCEVKEDAYNRRFAKYKNPFTWFIVVRSTVAGCFYINGNGCRKFNEKIMPLLRELFPKKDWASIILEDTARPVSFSLSELKIFYDRLEGLV